MSKQLLPRASGTNEPSEQVVGGRCRARAYSPQWIIDLRQQKICRVGSELLLPTTIVW